MRRFIDLTEDEYDFNMAVNAKGVFLCSQVAARRPIIDQGAVARSSTRSTAGKWGAAPYLAHYVASSSPSSGSPRRWPPSSGRAEFASTASARASLRRACRSVARLGVGAPRDEHTRPSATCGSPPPLGRIETEDVALAVAFLASEDARFVTWEALAVNGGAFMVWMIDSTIHARGLLRHLARLVIIAL